MCGLRRGASERRAVDRSRVARLNAPKSRRAVTDILLGLPCGASPSSWPCEDKRFSSGVEDLHLCWEPDALRRLEQHPAIVDVVFHAHAVGKA